MEPNNFKIADLTEQDMQAIKNLENEPGLALIAYENNEEQRK